MTLALDLIQRVTMSYVHPDNAFQEAGKLWVFFPLMIGLSAYRCNFLNQFLTELLSIDSRINCSGILLLSHWLADTVKVCSGCYKHCKCLFTKFSSIFSVKYDLKAFTGPIRWCNGCDSTGHANKYEYHIVYSDAHLD